MGREAELNNKRGFIPSSYVETYAPSQTPPPRPNSSSFPQLLLLSLLLLLQLLT